MRRSWRGPRWRVGRGRWWRGRHRRGGVPGAPAPAVRPRGPVLGSSGGFAQGLPAPVALLLVLAASLYRDCRNVVAGRLAVAFALGSAVHAAISGIGSISGVSLWHAPLIALSTGNVVVFWLFCRALFDDAFSLR